MADIKVKVRLEDVEFKSQMNETQQAVNNFGKSVNGASQQISEAVQKQVRAAESMGNYRRELRNTVKSLQNLQFAYADLSDADKNGDFGRALLQRINELQNRGAELRDTINDVNQTINNLASDTLSFDAFKESVEVGRDLMSAVVSSMELAGAETEQLQNVMKKLAQIYTVSNSLISIGNVLQKQSSVMSKIQTTQNALLAASERIKTAATAKGTVATIAATAAQKAFNLVAKANPYVLLATAILAAGTAIYAYVKRTNEATTAEKERQAALKKTNEQAEHYADVMSGSIGSVIAKYNQLRASYLQMKTAGEKIQWIKDNKSANDQLFGSINNINKADDIFIRKSEQVKDALMKRAKAAAYAQLYQEEYTKMLREQFNPTVENYGKYYSVKAGEKIKTDDTAFEKAKLGEGDFVWRGKYKSVLTPQGERKYNQYLNDETVTKRKAEQAKVRKKLDELFNAEMNANQEAAEAAKKLGIKFGGSSSGDDNKTKAKKGSYKYLLEQQQKFEQGVQEGRIVLPKDELNRKREELQKAIDKKAIEIGLEPEPTSIAGLEKQINQLKDKINKNMLNIPPSEAKQLLHDLEQQLSELKIQAELEPKPGSVAELEKRLSTLQNNYRNGWLDISPEQYQKVSEELKKEIESQSIKLNIKIDPKIEKEKEVAKHFQELIKPRREQSSFQSAISTVTDPTAGMTKMEKNDYMLEAIEKSMDANDELLDALQKDLDKLREIGSVGSKEWNDILTKINEVNEAQETLGNKAIKIEKQNKILEKQENTWQNVGDRIADVGSIMSSMSKVADDDKGLAVAGIIAEAVANVLLGYSQASAQSTSMSPIGWLAFSLSALAATMGMVAQIKSAGAFASGGIVGGGTGAYTDGLTAQVSGGEMILNGSQQNRLWRIISGQEGVLNANGFPEQVEFKIKGDTLYGVLRNYGKQQKALSRAIEIG